MNIPLIDRSNYLKGLFITAKLDKELNPSEKEILKKISDKLGFANDFFQESIKTLLTNKYIKEEPIVFSDKEIAMSFISDAIKLACANNLITDTEVKWLKNIAEVNQLSTDIIDNELKVFKESPKFFAGKDFALFSIL